MMIRLSITVLTVFMASFLGSSIAFAQEADITVSAGIAKRGPEQKFKIFQKTTVIPFTPKTVDPEFFFGMIASSSSGKEFKCRAVFYLPKNNVVHEINSQLDDKHQTNLESQVIGGDYTVIKTIEKEGKHCDALLRLDEDDAPGKYIVIMHVAGKFKKKAVFDVQKATQR